MCSSAETASCRSVPCRLQYQQGCAALHDTTRKEKEFADNGKQALPHFEVSPLPLQEASKHLFQVAEDALTTAVLYGQMLVPGLRAQSFSRRGPSMLLSSLNMSLPVSTVPVGCVLNFSCISPNPASSSADSEDTTGNDMALQAD